MYRSWSTVGAGAHGGVEHRLPASHIQGASRRVSWPREQHRKRGWRFTNHAALAAVLIVALLTGYVGFRSGLPGGGSNQDKQGTLSSLPSTPYAMLTTNCTTELRTVDDVANVMSTSAAPAKPDKVTVSSEAPDAETIAGVKKTQDQLVACAEDPLRTYSLYSNDCLRSELLARYPDAELKPAIVGPEVAAEATTMAGKRATVVKLATPGASTTGVYDIILDQDIELLSDGRVGAIVRQASVDGETALIPQSPRYRFFVKVGDQWLYDCDAPQSHG